MTGSSAGRSVANVDFESRLARLARTSARADLHATMAIATPDSRLTVVAVSDRGVTFDSTLNADVTFVFDSAETALRVLSGAEDPIAAFMEGRFRADGHLPLAFVLLGLFRRDVDTAPPP